jgi:hypothetical protein
LSTTDWVDPHRTFVITMRAVLVLDGEIRLTSRPVKVNVQPSVTAKTDAAADWVATADSLQVFGASLPEARLAIEEVVPDRPLQAGLLRQIDAFELRASGLSAAEEPLIAWTTLQRDGGELRQSLESGVPVDVRNAVAIRASVIAGQLKILKLVQGGAAEALAGIYSRRLGLNTEQLWATSAVFSRLQGTADDAEPPKSPAAKAEPLIKAYRDFRALLNPQQRVTFDRSE